jgi:gas vesicle protein
MNKIKIYIFSSAFALLTLLPLGKVFAEDNVDVGKKPQNRPQDMGMMEKRGPEDKDMMGQGMGDKQRKPGMIGQKPREPLLDIEEHCEEILERITNLVSKYKDGEDIHITRYDEVLSRLEDIAEKLADKGLDVTELEDAIAEWKTLVENYTNAYGKFISALETASGYTCGEEDDAIKEQLEEARELRKEAEELRRETRSYYADEIRSAIKSLRDQARELADEE